MMKVMMMRVTIIRMTLVIMMVMQAKGRNGQEARQSDDESMATTVDSAHDRAEEGTHPSPNFSQSLTFMPGE